MVNPLPVACNEPTPPPMDCNTTRMFGAPIGTPGRGAAQVNAIAIHGLRDTYDGYLSKACVSNTRFQIGCHVSMHYVIDGDSGLVSMLVPESDIAWAFQPYRTNFPITSPLDCCICPEPCPQPPCPGDSCIPTSYPGWTTLSGLYPNLAADFYAISIGITVPSRPEQIALDGVDCCPGPWGMSPYAYEVLVRLIAWIQSRYPAIQVSPQYINFHDNIVVREEDCRELPCGPQGACLICDVTSYCERCLNPIDPTISRTTSNVRYLLAENDAGCRVKILLSDLNVLLDALP